MTSSVDPGAREAEVARLQAECDRLTYELGHRVKNTLSMVQALANQTFRDIRDADGALATFNDRVLALARANDTILRESWTTATIGAVAGSLQKAPHLGGRLEVDGPSVRIGAGAALSFATALHELATNAKRYGAWSAPGGQVTLSWTVTGEGPDGGVLDLCWSESGGPPTEPPQRRGFGLRLAEQSLRSAFGRDVRFAFEPSGLVCRVHAPLSALTH